MTATSVSRTTSATPSQTTAPADLARWVDEMASLTSPDSIVWCDGSDEERQGLIDLMIDAGTLVKLNPEKRPRSYLARSNPSDVARVESRTFICTDDEDDAGPTNNWADPASMRETLTGLFTGAMKGRTMYVVPFAMGPVGGALTRYGVQVTDSPYVVVSMGVMTRMGAAPLAQIAAGAAWVPAAHTVGAPLNPDDADVPWPCNETKYIVQFPATREIWSYGSAYGGNAILAKKAFALRIATALGHDEGWLAAHMLLLKVTPPADESGTPGVARHVAAAFPSACGKTNFAMMRPAVDGWKVETLGDDIAWIGPGEDGRLRAINPEAGFFGVAPGTSVDTNPVAMETLVSDTIFTNVALTDDGDVWWEGMTKEPPAHLIDWRGNDWTPESETPAAHPNARFTVAAHHCPTIAEDWDAPDGVVLDAIVFGGRRATQIPLVAQAFDWRHGVLMGASLASEQTAAAEGPVGKLRRDPLAMLPFCGIHMADHWADWLRVGAQAEAAGAVAGVHGTPHHAPAIFHVNWFRKGPDGTFLWPGFGENIRVLAWALGRLSGTADAERTPFGWLPGEGEIDYAAAGVTDAQWRRLMAIDPEALAEESEDMARYLEGFGDRVPAELAAALAQRLRSLRSAV
ncbi:phosphoenolpyruvate carboxykinase (GTP) [Demequina salsinemoris]|uniref:phosphoenolpyruvate carboxykinase (GTP) n=1 Tax=Demequina salsinemoris TaxID=577470 RepID=UPI0007810EA0|nr:phosphoenolpyruvate carboxykinase (GTP) [Demequina salsinemoris]